MKKQYYRLFDKERQEYIRDGYNVDSLEELFEDYVRYKTYDWAHHYDNGDGMCEIWDSVDEFKKLSYIQKEFRIEISEEPFETLQD